MTDAPSRFLSYLIIMSFAAGVVALGAKELQRRYDLSGSVSGKPGKIVKELHGDVDLDRASIKHGDPSSDNSGESLHKWWLGPDARSGAGPTGPVASEIKRGESPGAASENIDSKDQQSLKSLLEKLVP